MPDILSTEYINSSDYKLVEDKLKQLKSVLDDLTNQQECHRKLRYAEVDIEAERAAGRLQPDELYVPQHIIDTNVRREQSPYVQYITQSPRAVIAEDQDDSVVDLANLEKDLTKKLRYDAWQLAAFANIDAFQANGYSAMEVVMDQKNTGELAHENIAFGDFGFITDTKNIQSAEFTSRAYYYTRTKLINLCKGDDGFVRTQVDKMIGREPDTTPTESTNTKDKSLYKIYKVMFRIDGIVNVAWCCPDTCDDWVRAPRKLYLGMRNLVPVGLEKPTDTINRAINTISGGAIPDSQDSFETDFPYIIYPYLISENDTIAQLKGRIFLDQDLQEAVSSLISSTVTQARRAAGLYFAKDVADPNDDLLLQKNIFFKSGCIINSKVSSFQLPAPDPGMFTAINMLQVSNQNETSQVNFAVNNRKDSRKTATENVIAQDQQQNLSTVQVVLYSISLTQMYRIMVRIIRSRVLSGLIKVAQSILPLYGRRFQVKPSGDVDVIEKQQLIQKMFMAWQVIQNTPAAVVFLCDMIEMVFPERASKYVQILMQADAQQKSQQQQQMNSMLQTAMQMAQGVIKLSKSPEMFSDMGKLHALPIVEGAAEQLEQLMQPQRK